MAAVWSISKIDCIALAEEHDLSAAHDQKRKAEFSQADSSYNVRKDRNNDQANYGVFKLNN